MNTLEYLYGILNGLENFGNKVAYRAFPKGEAPDLPYICYLITGTNNFMADDVVYKEVFDINVELYTRTKEPQYEAEIEAAFLAEKITWNKTEMYLEDEDMYMIVYSIELTEV